LYPAHLVFIIQASFRSFLSDCKDDIFEDGSEVIMTRLSTAAENVGHALDDALGQLAEKIEVNLAVLWEGTRDDPEQAIARKRIVDVVATIKGQIDIWVEAEKTKRENAELSAQYLVDEDVEMQ
jgi:hypothetical protein